MREIDVAIVGAGPAGLYAAYYAGFRGLSTAVIDALPPAIEALTDPLLTAPAEGATAPILDLLIVSADGESPPVQVDVLGVSITTSDIQAHLSARTGEGQILGNILYNLANLADPGGPTSLLNLFTLLGDGSTAPVTTTGGSVAFSPAPGVAPLAGSSAARRPGRARTNSSAATLHQVHRIDNIAAS